MKKKIFISSICGTLFVLFLITLFFAVPIEKYFKLKPDLYEIEEDAFEVHFIDVGQGDCVAIRFSDNTTMLVDSGPSSGRDNLEEYLTKIFFYDHYNKFDYVFLTHSDIDHSGNMEYILNNFEVGNFYRPRIYSANTEANKTGFKVDNEIYDRVLSALKMKNITTNFTTDNVTLNLGVAEIEMYVTNENHDEANNYSPFLIVSSENKKICLSGDAGEDVELEMIERGVLTEVDIMKLAHHGSKYSNTYELIEVLSPTYVACSVGENSHGHPASEVLLRLANFDDRNNSTTYETLKSTLNDGNFIYYVNHSKNVNVVVIGDLGSYLFLDWYVIALIAEFCLLVIFALSVIPNNPIKINAHMKNMKQ